MLNRREFLERTFKTSSLIALGSTVPGFLASAARAADSKKDTILVVLELNGGNDGLNTVIPHGDDLYYKARPTLRFNKPQLVKVDDHIGLHPGLRSFERLLGQGQLAIVQGVGYPNPNRSHFESMDIWQTGDPSAKLGDGWLSRGLSSFNFEGKIPAMYVGADKLPLALQGPTSGIASVHPNKHFDLHLGGNPEQNQRLGRRVFRTTAAAEVPGNDAQKAEEKRRAARRQLIQDLTKDAPVAPNMLPFVQRSALQTYTTVDRLRDIMRDNRDNDRYYREVGQNDGELGEHLGLIARMIHAGFGTRIFYVSLGGFDTHSNQAERHQKLLQEIGNAVTSFFDQLASPSRQPVAADEKVEEKPERSDVAQRVLVMTFSEFGRRVYENGSRGTDHGSASCLFVAGPGVKGGVIGKHPSLKDLDDGDLKFHTDFRQVYATLLDGWLGCDSRRVLGGQFEHLPLLKQ